jgi:7-cyano-7-deazaguanine synthase
MKAEAIAIVSGGMDSTVLAYDLRYTGHTLHLLSFNYGLCTYHRCQVGC